MSARDNILARIRAQQGKPEVPGADELASVDEYIAAHAAGARPRPGGEPAAVFQQRALALSTTLATVGALDAVPQAVSAYLRENGLPDTAVCWPEFASLAWEAAGLKVEARGARDGDAVGITGAFCAIAETGTLLLLSGSDTPATVSLLPETHVAVVRASRIVAGMEDAFALVRAERGAMPRAANFVSGPSRTADIEQTVTLGAHGPYRVHILLVDG